MTPLLMTYLDRQSNRAKNGYVAQFEASAVKDYEVMIVRTLKSSPAQRYPGGLLSRYHKGEIQGDKSEANRIGEGYGRKPLHDE